MSSLLLFNPEHDYALAHGGSYYFAPASIRKLASDMQFLPTIWGKGNDFILKTDNQVVPVGNLSLARPLSDIVLNLKTVEPWGWDKAIRYRLTTLGIPESLLMDMEDIEKVRRLSHRRISIECNRDLDSPAIPQEFHDIEGAMEYALKNNDCYFKLPWSSGGRGVLSTEDMNPSQIKEWLRGAIRRQGSVLAENKIERQLDFASLWNIDGGLAVFEGLSISISDGRGKYKGNVYGNQAIILQYIQNFTCESVDTVVEKQKVFLDRAIGPFYKGKLGIDMICSKTGELFPCIEINLRRTMGHVAMDYAKSINYKLSYKVPLINIKDLTT